MAQAEPAAQEDSKMLPTVFPPSPGCLATGCFLRSVPDSYRFRESFPPYRLVIMTSRVSCFSQPFPSLNASQAGSRIIPKRAPSVLSSLTRLLMSESLFYCLFFFKLFFCCWEIAKAPISELKCTKPLRTVPVVLQTSDEHR